jgi:hypothetical protein
MILPQEFNFMLYWLDPASECVGHSFSLQWHMAEVWI